ncbi:MAG: glycosyltransferase family 39 protein [Candidatus Curtissbacteria bacterium]|nr:glycosyltransferase family 39 protein [Candidatus Curtissbacteria bacterium]
MFSVFAQTYLTRGFWGDEAWTSLISQLPYSQMLKTTAADFHPPAYYSIVEAVYKFLPPTEIVTRSISIFFFLATIYLVYLLASLFKGPSFAKASEGRHLFGILSAVAVFVNPIFFRYAFEARNYTLFAFAATGSVYFLLRLSEKFTRKSAILFVLFSTLGIYTHYYMFFTILAEGLYVLLFDRKILVKTLGLGIACGVLYLPWIPFLAKQVMSAGASFWIGAINISTHYEALLRILAGEEQNAFQFPLFWLSAGLLLVGIYQHLVRRKFEKPYMLIWLWAIVPFILASLPGLKVDEFKFPLRPLFFWRYLIGASVPLSMVAVHSGQKLPPVLFKISIGAVLILALLIDFRTFFSSPYSFREVYRDKVVPQITPGDTIVTVLPSFAEVTYYRNRSGITNNIVVLPEGLIQFSGKALLDTMAQDKSVTIEATPSGRIFQMTPGPSLNVRE